MRKIVLYKNEMQNNVVDFFKQVFKENHRTIDFEGKDKDILQISESYIKSGNFWCALNDSGKIIGTIGIRARGDFYEIRRFFVGKKEKNHGLGQRLLVEVIEYSIINGIKILKAGTMEDGKIAQYLFQKFGFILCKRYGNSSADIFYKLVLDTSYIYIYINLKLED